MRLMVTEKEDKMKRRVVQMFVVLFVFGGFEKAAAACGNIGEWCLFNTDCCSGLCSWLKCFHTCWELECKNGDSWCVNSDGNFDHVDEVCSGGGYCSDTYCKNGDVVYDDVGLATCSNGTCKQGSTKTVVFEECNYGCDENSGSAKCKPAPCVNECNSINDKGCGSGNQNWHCYYDADNCLKKSYNDCPNGQICSSGNCVPDCTNNCSPSGDKECMNSTSIHTCGNYDTDSCLEWGGEQSCKCYNDACQSCSNECSSNDKGCNSSGTKKWSCQFNNSNGCYYKDYVSCDFDESCSNGYCEQNCSSSCSWSGEKECMNDISIHTCGNYDGDSCLEWGAEQSCPCYNDSCKSCVDQCTIVDKGCNSSGTQNWHCFYNAGTGCWEKSYNDCSSDQVCAFGDCISTCSNFCSPSGDKECLDAISIHTCGNYDGDSCLEWGGEQSCQCYNDACQSCSDECSSNDEGCNSSGTKKWSCKFNNSNGCYYKDYVSCSLNEECQDGYCGKFCSSDCTNLWETECLSSTAIHTCGSYDTDPCLEWGDYQSCICYNDACQSCSDECNKNDVGCDLLNLQKWNCVLNSSNGCYEKQYTSCDILSVCSKGNCVAACTNDCSPSGDQQCMSETSIKVCGNYDNDYCFEWGDFQSCICYNDACQSCTDECESTETGCDNLGLQKWICLKDLNTGCYKKNFSKCLLGVCLLGVCVAGCDDECTVSGNSECLDEKTLHTCSEFDGDACLEWGAEETCYCFNNACQECANECDGFEVGCNSSGTKKWNCNYDLVAGCYKKEYVNCDSNTSCQNGACVSNCGNSQDHKACAGNKLVWQNACNETTSIIDNCDLKPDVCNSSNNAVLSENVCFEQALACSYKTSTLCNCGCENNACKKSCCKNNCTGNSKGCEGTNKWICKNENGCLNKVYTTCASSEKCVTGECVPSCVDACAQDEKKCVDDASYHLCDCSQPGCCVWGKTLTCQENEMCDQGKCVTQVEPQKAIEFAKIVEWPYEQDSEAYNTALGDEEYLNAEEIDEIPLQYIENYQIFVETSGAVPTLKVNGSSVQMIHENDNLYSYRIVFDETKEGTTNNYTVKVNDNGKVETAQLAVFVPAIDYATASKILGGFFGLATDDGLKEFEQISKNADGKIPLNPKLNKAYTVWEGENYRAMVNFKKPNNDFYSTEIYIEDKVNKLKLHIIDDQFDHIDDLDPAKMLPNGKKPKFDFHRSTLDTAAENRGLPLKVWNVQSKQYEFVTLSEQEKVVRFFTDPPWTPPSKAIVKYDSIPEAANGAKKYLNYYKISDFKARPSTMEGVASEIGSGSSKLSIKFGPALKVAGKVLVALAVADILYSLYQQDYKDAIKKTAGFAAGWWACGAAGAQAGLLCVGTIAGAPASPICAFVGCIVGGVTAGWLVSEGVGYLYEITLETDQGDEQFEIIDAPQYLVSEGKYGGFAYNLMDEIKSTCNNVGYSETTMCLDYNKWQNENGVFYEPDNELVYPTFTVISSNPETATMMQIFMENNDESQGYVKYKDKNYFVWTENGGYVLQPIDAQEMPLGNYTEFTLSPNYGNDETCVSQSNAKPVAKAKVIEVDLDEQAEAPVGVGLSGVDSYDANGDKLSYMWEQLSGFPLEYDKSATHIKLIVIKGGIYKFKLTVNDGELESAPDDVTFLIEGEAGVVPVPVETDYKEDVVNAVEVSTSVDATSESVIIDATINTEITIQPDSNNTDTDVYVYNVNDYLIRHPLCSASGGGDWRSLWILLLGVGIIFMMRASSNKV